MRKFAAHHLPLALAALLLAAWTPRTVTAQPRPDEKPIREIFVPFEDLDVLLEGQAQRVFLTRQEYEDLIRRAKRSPVEQAPHSWLMLSADYQAAIAEGRAAITGSIEINVFDDGLLVVPLDFQGVGIRAATLDQQPAALGRDEQGRVVLFLEGRGNHRLQLDLVTRLATTAAQQSLDFQLPRPPATRFQLTVPGNVEVRSGAAVSRRDVDDQGAATHFELVLPAGQTTLVMSLNNRLLREQRVVVARSLIVDEVTQAYERLHTTMALGVLHGAVDRFQFVVPAGFEVTDVVSPLLARWVVEAGEGEDQRVLTVMLREPTRDMVVLNVSATATKFDADSWTMPQLAPLDVVSHSAVVGLLLEDRLKVNSIETRGLVAINAGVLQARLPQSVFIAEPGAPRIRPVVAYYAPQAAFHLSARFQLPPPRVHVTSHLLLVLDEKQNTLRGGFTLAAEAEKLFALDLAVPAGWTVTEVTDRDGAALQVENFTAAGEAGRIHVRLPQGVQPGQPVELFFTATATPDQWLEDWSQTTIAFPVFAIRGAERDQGAIAVQATDDLIVRPEAIAGLTPLDEAEKAEFGMAESPTNLAYRYTAQPYAATIGVERTRPWITARTFNFLRIEPQGLSAHYQLNYDVRQARTRRLVFSLPAATPEGLSIRGLDGVVLKEYGSELADGRRRWSVLLAEPQAGEIRLAVDFQERLSSDQPKDWSLPLVEADEVAYQSAIVAVEGNAEFDIDLNTSGRKIDVGELADAEYQPSRRLLGAFGFVGSQPHVSVDVFRRPGYGLPPAIVQHVELVTLISTGGRSTTQANYALRTKAAYLEVELPAGDGEVPLWSAVVDGRPAMPQREGDRLLLSLPPTATAQLRNVQLVYETPVDEILLMGDIETTAPTLFVRNERGDERRQVPVADLTWRLVLPDGHRVVRTGGSIFVDGPPPPARFQPVLKVAAVAYWLAGGVNPFYRRGRAGDVMSKVMPQASMRSAATDEAAPSVADHRTFRDRGRQAGGELALPKSEMDAEMEVEMFDAPAEEAPQLDASMPDAPPTPFGGLAGAPPPAPSQPAPGDPAVAQPQTAAVAPPAGPAPARGEAAPWAMQGVRSLPIDLEDAGEQVTFQSMGVAPQLKATLINTARLDFLSWGLALLVGLIGIALTPRPPARKARFVIEAAVLALLLPIAVGWLFEINLGGTFDTVFYAACLLAPYYLLAGLLKWVSARLRSLPRLRRAATAAGLLLLLLPAPAAWGQQPAVDPADLLLLLTPPRPVTLPADAVIIPYDAGDAEGIKNAEKVLVPYDEYVALWNRAFPDRPIGERLPPVQFALAGARYTTELADDEFLAVQGHIDVDLYVDEPVEIPLSLGGAVLTAARLDGETARISVIAPAADPPAAAANQAAQIRAPGPPQSLVVVHAQGKGRRRLELSLRLRLERSGGWRIVSGTIPAAPAAALTLRVPQARTEVRLADVADRASYETENDGQQITTALDAAGALRLQWRPKVAAGQIDQSLTAHSTAVFDVREDGLQLAWRVALQLRSNQRETFTMLVPADYLIERVSGDNVRGWNAVREDDAQRVDVTLLKAARGSESITLYLTRREPVGQGDLTRFSAPLVTIPDAVLHQGHLTIRRSPLLDVRSEGTAGVSQADMASEAAEVMASIQEESPLGIREFKAFRFTRTPFEVELFATPYAADTSAEVQAVVRVGQHETTYEGRVFFDVRQRAVFQTRLYLPPGLQVDQVQAAGEFEWAVTGEEDRRLLTVYLAAGQPERFSIVVSGRLPHDAAADTLAVPRLEVLDVAGQRGQVVVQVDPAYAVSAAQLRQCRAAPANSVPPWLKQEQQQVNQLVLNYDTADYDAVVAMSLVQPRVKALAITNVRVTPREIEETVFLKFTVEQAGIRQVAFLLPQRMREALFTLPMLRQKTIEPLEDNPELVRVTLELQDDRSGELVVLVQNDRALTSNAHDAPIPVIETGVTESRYVVLENAGRDEVVVAEQEGLSEIKREEPKWATLAAVLGDKINQAFLIEEQAAAPRLAYQSKRREVVDTAGAAIRIARAQVLVDANGTYRGLQQYQVDNKTEQFLEVELPGEAQLWTVRVAGEPVKPTELPAAGNNRQLQIPLIKTAAGDLDYRVDIKYGGRLPAYGWLRSVSIPLVRTMNIKAESSQVRLYLPDSHRHFNFGGTMTRVDEEGDLEAGYLVYLNRQAEALMQVMNEGEEVFERMRAKSNLKQLDRAMQGYVDASGKYSSNPRFDQELRNNTLLRGQAAEQLQQQEQQADLGVETGNRSRLMSAYESQRAGRAKGVVTQQAQNFDMRADPDDGQGKAAAEDFFNSRWLESNQLAGSGPGAASGAAAGDRKADQRIGKAAPTVVPQNQTLEDSAEQFRRLAKDADTAPDVSRESATREDGLKRQIDRYQMQLDEQAQLQSLDAGQLNAPAAQESRAPGMGGGGMGGGGFGGGMPGQMGRGAPDDALSGLIVDGVAAAQGFGQDMQVPQFDDAGLASLDVELPLRGAAYFFTTPLDDVEITARSIAAVHVDRGSGLAAIVAALLVLLAAWKALGYLKATVRRRWQVTALLALGAVSVFSGFFPVAGLVLAALGVRLWWNSRRRPLPAAAA